MKVKTLTDKNKERTHTDRKTDYTQAHIQDWTAMHVRCKYLGENWRHML